MPDWFDGIIGYVEGAICLPTRLDPNYYLCCEDHFIRCANWVTVDKIVWQTRDRRQDDD